MTAALWLSVITDGDSELGRHPKGGRTDPHSSERDAASADGAALREHTVVDAIRRGDRVAFDAWYSHHFEALWKLAYRFVPRRDVAKDIVQDVFVSFWVKHETFAPNGSLRSYVFGAVRNRALHVLRQAHTAERFVETGVDAQLLAGVTSNDPSANTDVETRELYARLFRLITALPERQRTALVLHVEHEMTASDVGRTLGISATAATNLIRRGIDNLRRGLAE